MYGSYLSIEFSSPPPGDPFLPGGGSTGHSNPFDPGGSAFDDAPLDPPLGPPNPGPPGRGRSPFNATVN